MNIKTMRTLIIDALFYVGLWFCYAQPESQIAQLTDNIISFFSVIALIVGLIMLSLNEDNMKEMLGDTINSVKGRSKWFNKWVQISYILEIVIFAGLGWYYVAAFWLIHALGMHRIYKLVKEGHEE